jgi:hypothetical protein
MVNYFHLNFAEILALQIIAIQIRQRLFSTFRAKLVGFTKLIMNHAILVNQARTRNSLRREIRIEMLENVPSAKKIFISLKVCKRRAGLAQRTRSRMKRNQYRAQPVSVNVATFLYTLIGHGA